MTNLEWIIKKQKFSDFMQAVYCRDKSTLEKQFKVPIDTTSKSLDDCVTEWLQKEPTYIEYVQLNSVINLLNSIDEISPELLDLIKEKLFTLEFKEVDT